MARTLHGSADRTLEERVDNLAITGDATMPFQHEVEHEKPLRFHHGCCSQVRLLKLRSPWLFPSHRPLAVIESFT